MILVRHSQVHARERPLLIFRVGVVASCFVGVDCHSWRCGLLESAQRQCAAHPPTSLYGGHISRAAARTHLSRRGGSAGEAFLCSSRAPSAPGACAADLLNGVSLPTAEAATSAFAQLRILCCPRRYPREYSSRPSPQQLWWSAVVGTSDAAVTWRVADGTRLAGCVASSAPFPPAGTRSWHLLRDAAAAPAAASRPPRRSGSVGCVGCAAKQHPQKLQHRLRH